MRIGIDARFYGSVGKGLGRYTSELISHLEKIDDGNDYVIFLWTSNFDSYVPKNPRFTKVLAEFPWYTWREQVQYPKLLNQHGLDLIHFPHFNVPFFYRKPFVVTIHDLILLSHPTTRASRLGPLIFWIKFQFYRLVIRRAIADAETVITVSQTVKKEMLERFPFAKQKNVVVTYEACAPSLQKTQNAQLRSDIKKPFALYVGNAYPHKNLERLVEAFAAFRKRAEHADWQLVLVGAEDYFYARLKKEAAENDLAQNVVFAGHVTDEELATLYENAAFYVFPSLCEGFGLPPLEAMQHGLPVTSSNASCMPEILGDAAHYFDPEKPAEIYTALTRMADDTELRAELIAKGRSQVAKYDWTRCAQQTLDAYLAHKTPR